jgi:hypothetical protein
MAGSGELVFRSGDVVLDVENGGVEDGTVTKGRRNRD